MNEEYVELGNGVFMRYSAIASIAAVAAFEVEGASVIHGKLTNDLLDKISIKALKKSIELTQEDGDLVVTVNTKVKYGMKIEDVSKKIQEIVVEAIKMATGIQVRRVNVNVVGIDIE